MEKKEGSQNFGKKELTKSFVLELLDVQIVLAECLLCHRFLKMHPSLDKPQDSTQSYTCKKKMSEILRIQESVHKYPSLVFEDISI